MKQYEPMDVLNSVKEPFNKNTFWIYPNEEDIEVKLFDKGWKTIFTTKDLGLSDIAKEQVENLVNELRNTLNFKFNKEYGKYKSTLVNLMNRNRELELQLSKLEAKVDKLTKRYGNTLLAKN